MSFQSQRIVYSDDGVKPIARSSHSVDVVGDVVYVIGGEHEPRVPIGNDVWCLDLTYRKWKLLETKGISVPDRNAHASAVVGSCIYMFGGRQGINMGENSLADLYKLDTDTGAWSEVSMAGDVPQARSYHSMVPIGTLLYVFGGCTHEGGRSNELHEFDTDTGVWRKLPTFDVILGRGGAGFVAVGKKLYVVGGFTGKEMGDVYEFDTEINEWKQIETSPSLPPRSVFGIVALATKIFVLGGEVDPSEMGHQGAGQFCNEVWVLDTADLQSGWLSYEAGDGGGEAFPHRGWFKAAPLGLNGIVLFGGNALDNSRMDDAYVLRFGK